MKARIGWISLFLVCSLAARDAQKILDRVESTLQNTRGLQVEFEEVFQWKLTGEENSVTGTLLMKGDDRFRIETEDQIIVSNGDTLWTYSKPANRVLIDQLGQTRETLLPRQILMQYSKRYQATLADDEVVFGRACHVIRFHDPAQEHYYVKIMLWVDKSDWLPVKILQEDVSGNQNIFLLKSVEKRDEIENRHLRFNIPDGADVIRM